jgi:hypothetical protein
MLDTPSPNKYLSFEPIFDPLIFFAGRSDGLKLYQMFCIFVKIFHFSYYCGRAGSETAVRTALVYYCILYIAAYIQGLYTVYSGAGVKGCCRASLATNQGRRQPPHYIIIIVIIPTLKAWQMIKLRGINLALLFVIE